MPPYAAAFRMRGGMNSPNDTAIIRLIAWPWGDDGSCTLAKTPGISSVRCGRRKSRPDVPPSL